MNIPAPVLVACYCIAGIALIRALWGPGEPPYGCDSDFWVRAVRHWRHKRRAKR